MKIKLTLVVLLMALYACKDGGDKSSKEKLELLTEAEIEDGWVSLFDGETFNGWHNYLTDTISDEWQIKDRTIIYTPNPERYHGTKNMMTDKTYTDFILSIEWKISESGNSGIFWGVFEDEKYAVPYQTGPEIQILDNYNHPDRTNQLKNAGAIFGILGPEENHMKKDEWNHFLIQINHKKNKGSVTLNANKIIEFPVHGLEWEQLIANSHFKDWEGFGIYQSGHISLQDHATQVSFRNIKIKELK